MKNQTGILYREVLAALINNPAKRGADCLRPEKRETLKSYNNVLNNNKNNNNHRFDDVIFLSALGPRKALSWPCDR